MCVYVILKLINLYIWKIKYEMCCIIFKYKNSLMENRIVKNNKYH